MDETDITLPEPDPTGGMAAGALGGFYTQLPSPRDREYWGNPTDAGDSGGPPQRGLFTDPRRHDEQPEPDLPYTQADELNAQRLSQGLSHLRSKVEDGSLPADRAAPVMADITRQLKPLLERKQADQQKAKAAAFHEEMQSTAAAQAIQQANAAHETQNFGSRIFRDTDPITGQTTTYAQTEPGKWEVVPPPKGSEGEGQMGNTPAPGLESVGAGNADAGAAAAGDMPQWGGDYLPIGAGLNIGAAPPTLQPKEDGGGHTMTIYNGANRTVAHFDESGQMVGREDFDREGNRVIPGAQGQQQAADALWQQAIKQVGYREPPRMIMGPHGRLVPNIDHGRWETAVREIHNTLMKSQSANERAVQVQANRDYADALTNHPIKNYQDAADPSAARHDAIMDDFSKRHPNDPRVQQWKAERSAESAALAKKDPAAMSLGDLAKATIGAHANVQKMIEAEEKKLAEDETIVKEDTVIGGYEFNPKGTASPGPWKNVPPEYRKVEAVRRVRAGLTAQLEDTRKAGGQATRPAAGAPASPAPPAPPAPPAGAAPPKAGPTLAERKAELRRREALREPRPSVTDTPE